MGCASVSVDYLRVATLAEVPEGELRAFDLNGARVALANVENRLFAFADECPEDGCQLSEGRLDERGEVMCPCDGSQFDLETGEPVHGPAVDAVPVFPVRVEEGWIEVAVK
jgi:3-phenylpropionate/trans-cinnamate dioxygenase ferredoxin subunit